MIIFKIKELMQAKKMTRYRLQKLTNWNYRRVNAYFLGKVKQVSVEELDTLCKIFECDIDGLMLFEK